MTSVTHANLNNKRVLVRCDFNVPFEEGEIKDDWRLRKAIPTIQLLKKQGAKIILISHLTHSEVSNQRSKENSLKKVVRPLANILGEDIRFVNDCLGRKPQRIVNKMKPGQIVLLENLRFYKGETENSEEFARQLALMGQAYVNEAFSVSHRQHASITILPRLLPGFSGIWFEKEILWLNKVKQNPKRPMVAIIGGAKVETKIKAIKGLLRRCDYLLLGGRLSEIILRVKGIIIGKPWPSEEIIKIIQEINLTNTKLHLPLDLLASLERSGKPYVRQTAPAGLRKEELALDLGPDTLICFKRLIEKAGTVVWAGPLGLYEEKKFSKGTREIAEAIVKSNAFSVAGGGDTLAALKQFGLRKYFSFLSTGGGAMLSFLSNEKMPGLEALNYYD